MKNARSGVAIAKVETIPLQVPAHRRAGCEGPTETLLVLITDEAGRVGIGECDSPPAAVKAFIEMPTSFIWRQNMISLLLGADPCDGAALWQRLYEGTASPGRRGLAIHALSAIDMALYDLAGKQLELPAYRLLGGARRRKLTPYATIFPGLANGRPLGALMDDIARKLDGALRAGFRAVKVEVMFGDAVSDRELVDCIRQSRRLVGDGVVLMIDFGYRWRDWHDARRVLMKIADHDIYFAEATLPHDDLSSHARLAAVSPIRICGAEWAVTRWEILDWITVGRVSVVQPDPSRCGGLTEMRRIADMCELHGVQCIPHCWKTGILNAASLHIQAACPNVPYVEFMSADLCDSPLRRDLVSPEPAVSEGEIDLPVGPGLGLVLNEGSVEEFRSA